MQSKCPIPIKKVHIEYNKYEEPFLCLEPNQEFIIQQFGYWLYEGRHDRILTETIYKEEDMLRKGRSKYYRDKYL